MLSELWGFYPRLQEKLICKDEKQAKQGGEKRVVVMLRCRFMVRNMQPPPHPVLTRDSAHILVRVVFHLDQRNASKKPTLSSSSPNSPMSVPSCAPSPWLDSEPWCWCRRGIHPPIFPGNLPDVHARLCYMICQQSAAWPSFYSHQSGRCATRN